MEKQDGRVHESFGVIDTPICHVSLSSTCCQLYVHDEGECIISSLTSGCDDIFWSIKGAVVWHVLSLWYSSD